MTNLDLTEMRAELNAKEADLRRSIERLTAPPVDGATIGFGKRIGEGTTQAIQQMADASSAQALNSTLEAVLRAKAKLADGTYSVDALHAARLTGTVHLLVRGTDKHSGE